MDPGSYQERRGALLADPEAITSTERSYMDVLFHGLTKDAIAIQNDFNNVMSLRLFWLRYAPLQRGHKPSGSAIPWSEVGEKVLEGHLLRIAISSFNDLVFSGLPYGHDIRFKTDKVFLHLDIKSTGPTDNIDEVVSSPNQVTGDGVLCDDQGVLNSPFSVRGRRANMTFQPELPPFYIIDDDSVLTLTYYLKCVYSVNTLGDQPIAYVELICVPNGLLMFDGPKYAFSTPYLLTPGKDETNKKRKRTRIKLNPLVGIDPWRCQKLIFDDSTAGYRTEYRSDSTV